jgi:hypothetical protein
VLAEAPPDWPAPPAPSSRASTARAASAQLRGAGIRPSLLPVTNDSEQRWLRTNVARAEAGGYSIAIVTIPARRSHVAQFRIVADSPRRTATGPSGVTVEQNLVFRWVQTDRLHEFYQAITAARLAHRATQHRRRRELPRRGVVPAGGDAVTRARPPARRSPARSRGRGGRRGPRPTSRSAAARTAAVSITLPRLASRAASASSATARCRNTS